MRVSSRDMIVAGLLVTVGVLLRIQLQHIPNFAPVAGLALFAGFYFRSRFLALSVPLSVMAISDYWIGGYQAPLMIAVYGMLALPVFLRPLLRRFFRIQGGSIASRMAAALGLLGCGMAASISFFVVTNFVVWLTTGFYDRTFADLMLCYGQALPFFRYTLLGDASFSAILFGGYAALIQLSSWLNAKSNLHFAQA